MTTTMRGLQAIDRRRSDRLQVEGGVSRVQSRARRLPNERLSLRGDHAIAERGLRLLDRHAEQAVLGQVLADARNGRSGAIVLHGEPGIGKTALIKAVAASASGFRVAYVAGVEAESALGYAGLHQLLAPFGAAVASLPPPQRDAIGSAFGMAGGVEADRFLVSLAVLTVLSQAAADQPLLLAIDALQWLDRESIEVLAFVARRLRVDSIAMIFATRDASTPTLRGLPDLEIAGLEAPDAAVLVSDVSGVAVDQGVQRRLHEETRGNPQALVTLAENLTPAQLAGRAPLPHPLPLGHDLEESFARSSQSLVAAAQTFLLVVAAERTGDPALIWRAAARLGVDTEVIADQPVVDLVEVGISVVFRHPLTRWAVYSAASVRDRRRVHAALADAADPATDPDNRAWHRAAAAVGLSEDVAADLVRSAERARSRGGSTAEAALLARAAELTPDLSRRTRRFLAAAEAWCDAGDLARSTSLLDAARPGITTTFDRATALRLDCRLKFAAGDIAEIPRRLIEAGRLLGALDSRLARDILFDAMGTGIFLDRAILSQIAAAVRIAPSRRGDERSGPDLLLDGFGVWMAEGYEAAVPTLKEAIAVVQQSDDLRPFLLAARAANDLWDDEAYHAICAEWVERCRARGAVAVLPLALLHRAVGEFQAGGIDSMTTLVDEAATIARSLGTSDILERATVPPALSASWTGPETDARSVMEADGRDERSWGHAAVQASASRARALLDLGLGHYAAALANLRPLFEDDRPFAGSPPFADAIEAAVRSGDLVTATRLLEAFAPRARASGTHLALGLLARSQAMLADDESAAGLYLEATEHLRQTRSRPELARTHLLYGEWLRRHRHRIEARLHLREARGMFQSFGATFFAERARVELLATGERARQRSVSTQDQLTPQEAQIAHMAADGASNPQIASQLFITASTVEYHLRKVYDKLALNSRMQLAKALATAPTTNAGAADVVTAAGSSGLASPDPGPYGQVPSRARAGATRAVIPLRL